MARQRYRPRHGRQSKAELQVLLLHEELRSVYPDSASSYYGHSYQVSRVPEVSGVGETLGRYPAH